METYLLEQAAGESISVEALMLQVGALLNLLYYLTEVHLQLVAVASF